MPLRKGIKKRKTERKNTSSARGRRAKKSTEAKKTADVHIRLTKEEREALRANAEKLGLSFSAYVLDATIYSSSARGCEPSILSIDPKVAATRAELIELERHLFGTIGRLGVNINQIARALNVIAYSGDLDRPSDEPKRLDEALESINAVHNECEKCLATLQKTIREAHAFGSSH